MAERKLCSFETEECPTIARFEKKLDALTANSVEVNTKIAEFLAKHSEQEKNFNNMDKRVLDHERRLSQLNLECQIAKTLNTQQKIDLDKLGQKYDTLKASVDIKYDTVKDKAVDNKLLFYGGTCSGLLALIYVLWQIIFPHLLKLNI